MAHLLDNPTWTALTTLQAELALVEGPARRFPPDVCPHGAFSEPTQDAWNALSRLAQQPVTLFSVHPLQVPPRWSITRSVELYEMLQDDGDWLRESGRNDLDGNRIEDLTQDDLPQMTSLYEATRPGRTISPRLNVLGGFVGIKREDQLVAMACLRLHCPGYREISTVATRPGQTGRGYGTALVTELAQRILDHGETPFLTVRTDNTRAIEIYRRLGFRERIQLYSTTLRFDGAPVGG
ncbi:MAG TPA: GNAT family N-acetyltransferase [Verrucomicrobiae bacterium]|nr:GNAT family N-acetyltransferase [Verrucomicrobiae bacterium]